MIFRCPTEAAPDISKIKSRLAPWPFDMAFCNLVPCFVEISQWTRPPHDLLCLFGHLLLNPSYGPHG